MDVETNNDTLFVVLICGAFLSIPILLVFSISTCIAYSKTKEWRKEKARQNGIAMGSLESEPLAGNESESDLDPDDSDDEAELKLREEKRHDLMLTSKQYFWKSMGEVWHGNKNAGAEQKAKERKERQKLAKAIARELRKMERKNKKTNDAGNGEHAGDTSGLPSYSHVLKGEKRL